MEHTGENVIPTEDTVVKEVDLDAMSRSEDNGEDNEIPKAGTPPEEKKEEEVKEEVKTEEPVKTEEEIKAAAEAAAKAKPPEEAPTTHVDAIKGLYSQLEATYGEGFKLPEDITEENAVQKLADSFAENMDLSDIIHPTLLAAQEAINSGVDPNEAFSKLAGPQDVLQLGDKELMTLQLKQQLKVKDEDIPGYLEGMNVRLEALKLRTEITNQREENLKQAAIANEAKATTDAAARTIEREKGITEALESFKNKSEIYSIPVDAKHKQEFPEVFKRWTTPDQTGKAPVLKLLENNESLAELIFILENRSSIAETIFKAKSDTKEKIKEKLDLEAKTQFGGGNAEPGTIDLDALSRPSQY